MQQRLGLVLAALLAASGCTATPTRPPTQVANPTASLPTQVTPAPTSGLLSSPSETAPASSTPVPSASSGPMVRVPILYQHRVVPLPQGIGTWTDTARQTFLATDTLPWSFAAGDPAVAQ